MTETTGATRTYYTIGLDMISQSVNAAAPQYFIYDGHGSVRQMTQSNGALVQSQDFWYDAYGNELGGNTPQTNLLYCGEQRDSESGLYYLRARMYSPQTGRFTSIDPYEGNNTDPQSLHKYLYCHANPINGIDPSGNEFDLNSLMSNIAVRATMFIMQHPRLVTVVGIVVNMLLPQEFQEAMLASGIPPFQAMGEGGMLARGACKTIYAAKSPYFKNILKQFNKKLAGKYYGTIGNAFEEFFGKLVPNAERNVKTIGKNTIDYIDNGFAYELKTTFGYFHPREIQQLKAASDYAQKRGLSLVYVFLEKPPQKVIDQVQNAGGTVIYMFENGQ